MWLVILGFVCRVEDQTDFEHCTSKWIVQILYWIHGAVGT